MLDDKKASELVSKSLRYKLSDKEQAAVQEHLEQNDDTRRFAEVSNLIQTSVSEIAQRAELGDDTIAPGLSTDAKQRLRRSVSDAIVRESKAGGPQPSSVPRPVSESQNRTITGSATGAGADVGSRQAINRFNISRKIGEGGLGTVWLARDEKLKRTVAVKEMNAAAMESPVAWHRFHREAEITGHLEHPGIVPLYQFGIDSETQQPFYAMRFVGKRTLADAIVEHHERRLGGEDMQLQLHRLLADFLKVCQTVAYAHSRGVIHRDLKPENIAIDSFGQVIVLDWGLAKVLDTAELGTQLVLDNELDDSSLLQTMAGEVIGTPLYMSPEQAAGDLDDIDHRTDVYGLGAVLFAVLTGNAPHEKTARGGDKTIRLQNVLDAIAGGDTPKPTDIAENIPRILENICLKAMARRRYSRFETVTDLADAVEQWMVGQTDRAARYESLRREGRELKNDFQAGVDDLESNVRFASLLPPVQELIRPETPEEEAVWRERLTSIFTGLMRAKPAFSRIVFSRVEDDAFTEIVRVERHSRDRSTVRKVPRSRLRTGAANDFIKVALSLQPEEVVSSLVCDPLCDQGTDCHQPHLVAGLTIYDEQTEEPFGVLMIDCDLDAVFERQMRRPWTSGEIVVACDKLHTLMHAVNGRINEASAAQPVVAVQPEFQNAMTALQSNMEYLDDTDSSVYGIRLWLIEKKHGLVYLLRQNQD